MDRDAAMGIELRHLRYFLAVAEELNVSRAAARLGIAQPPLSQQIRQLEEEVGHALFHRLPRGMALTEAGLRLQRDAAEIVARVGHAVQDARRAALGELGSVRIGFTSSASFNPFVTTAIRDYRRTFPQVQVELAEETTARLLELARAGRVDVAFLRPAQGEAAGLTLRRVLREEMVAALPAIHPLAAQAAVRLEELRDELFILYPRANGPAMYDAILGACRAAGFEPKIGQGAPQMASTVNLVATGIGVSIVPASMAQLAAQAVAYRRIRGSAPKAELALVQPAGATSQAARNFVQLVLAAAPRPQAATRAARA